MNKNIIALLVIIPAIWSLVNKTKGDDQPDLTGEEVDYVMPTFDNDTSVHINYKVYYYKDLVFYNYSYILALGINRQPYKYSDKEAWLVFHKDSIFGRHYTPGFKPDEGTRLGVDSMLNIIKVKFELDTLIRMKPDSVAKTKNTLKEFYFISPTKEFDMSYTLELNYDRKLRDMKTSFSKKLDSIKGMKLHRIHITFHKHYSDIYKRAFPTFESTAEVKRIQNPKRDVVLEYFYKYMNSNH
jgi:hypothetical protein